MQPIVSGPTTERVVRTGLVLGLFAVFAVLYLRDGYGGYAHNNVVEFLEKEGLPTDDVPAYDPTLTQDSLQERLGQLRSGDTLAIIKSKLGEPHLVRDDDLYYFGPGGRIHITLERGRLSIPPAEVGMDPNQDPRVRLWEPGNHTEADQRLQRWIGYVVSVGTIFFLYSFVGVITTKATLTDEGLTARGAKGRVPFSAMKGFRSAEDYPKRGWLELEFEEDGQTNALRLDDYHLKQFKPIVETIAERCGFENPLPKKDGDTTVTGPGPEGQAAAAEEQVADAGVDAPQAGASSPTDGQATGEEPGEKV
jgi:hypothetical protein